VRHEIVVGDIGGGEQRAVGERHSHPLRLRAIGGRGFTVRAGRLVAGPTDLTGVVRGEERPDDELTRPDRAHRRSDFLHNAAILMAHRPGAGQGLDPAVGPQV
jgi:hypothetical protein